MPQGKEAGVFSHHIQSPTGGGLLTFLPSPRIKSSNTCLSASAGESFQDTPDTKIHGRSSSLSKIVEHSQSSVSMDAEPADSANFGIPKPTLESADVGTCGYVWRADCTSQLLLC